jgi:palmitoyltransferase ZDHHC4
LIWNSELIYPEIIIKYFSSVAINISRRRREREETMDMMTAIVVGIYLATTFFAIYIWIFADPSTNKLAYYLTVAWPNKLHQIGVQVLGDKTTNLIITISDAFMYWMYVVIVFGSWFVIFFYTYPWIDESEGYISSYHKMCGYVVFLCCVSSWRLASTQSPGIITNENIENYDNYPYDGILFVEDRICPTLGIRKLARSKFDRYSGAHIAKFDHFCGWLGNAIGEENYRWFLLFLLVHAIMLVYGSMIVGWLLEYEIDKDNLWDVTFINAVTEEEIKATPYIVFQYIFQKQKLHVCLFTLIFVMAIVLILFLGYHIWLVSIGMTTNEASKWSQINKWYSLELKRYQNALKDGFVEIEDDVRNSTSFDNNQDTTPEEESPEKIFNPGPKPKNAYNYGFIRNWQDVLYPRSLRNQTIERHKLSKKNE